MHFAIHKLPPSSHPSHRRVQTYYISYTFLLCTLQLYILFAIIYHGRLLDMPFDPTFVFHIFLTWITTVANIGRFVEHVRMKDFAEYMACVREGKAVGGFNGVFAGIWFLPYIMLPFAIFGDFRYQGLTWLIPLPMISGFILSRWLHRRLDATYHTGEYAKLASDEEDVLINRGVYREHEEGDGLPAYEERDSSSTPPPPSIAATTTIPLLPPPSSSTSVGGATGTTAEGSV
ncbi:hypothetical protein TWF730_004034 [Orbilia blumenaviensis]|uniref:Uncharacterized protein n=1 Tax=Orbilia blumenaviensis TaxID=1796055 RepID=A0AAV9U1L7_9PEZI